MRMFFLFVRVAALVTAVSALISRVDCVFATGTCLAANLFSYFTIHSNIIFVLVLIIAMYYGALSMHEPEWLTAVRALTTAYMIVSGLAFALLMINADLMGHLFLVPLSSKVLHFVIPCYAVLDFLLIPARHRLHWSVSWLSMVFPFIWAVYTLVRGRLAGWYPFFSGPGTDRWLSGGDHLRGGVGGIHPAGVVYGGRRQPAADCTPT